LGVDTATLDVALVMPSNESVRTAVEAGAGVAVLSALVVAPAIKTGTLHAAPIAFAPALSSGCATGTVSHESVRCLAGRDR
jgi:DNA-binding transcriptional LysR family regulator